MNRLLGLAICLALYAPFQSHAEDVVITAAADSQHQDWKLIADDNGVRTFQRQGSTKYAVGFRGEITVDQPIEKVAALLSDMESRKKWMDAIVETYRVQFNSIIDRVEYNHTKVSWPFQDRDFVYSVKVDIDAKARTMMINMQSTTHEKAPEKDGVVRGDMKVSRYFVKETIPGKQTFISVEIEIDPKGAIPMWLVRLKQRQWPENTLSGLREYLKNNEIAIPKEFQQYITPVKSK